MNGSMGKNYSRRYEIDWNRFPSVVFESDDWGACEVVKDRDDAAYFAQTWNDIYGEEKQHPVSTLENVDDLERLYQVLEKFRGVDGQQAVFTAFVCVGNPDYQGIRNNNFTEYRDIGIAQGVPPGWEKGDIPGKWRDGIARGVFAPEFHANLHHTSPVLLMERLRASSPEGEIARKFFDKSIYCQGAHLPEYEGMNVREQNAWVKTGVERFTRAVGYLPAAAVTSDAYPVTETIWSINGIRVVSLKNSKLNGGEVVVYHTKPWNNQDAYVPVGAYNEVDDVVYLIRNVWFENFLLGDSQSVESVLKVAGKLWKENEPAIVSTHRIHYASLDQERTQKSLGELERLLDGFSKIKNIHFLTSAELGGLYRNGWSQRRTESGVILRKWVSDIPEIRIEGQIAEITSLPEGKRFEFTKDGDFSVCDLPVGDYRLIF